jgi:hypothetical protein
MVGPGGPGAPCRAPFRSVNSNSNFSYTSHFHAPACTDEEVPTSRGQLHAAPAEAVEAHGGEAAQVLELRQQLRAAIAEAEAARGEAAQVPGLRQQLREATAKAEAARGEAAQVPGLRQQLREATAEAEAARGEAAQVPELRQQLRAASAEAEAARGEAAQVSGLRQQLRAATAEAAAARVQVAHLVSQLLQRQPQAPHPNPHPHPDQHNGMGAWKLAANMPQPALGSSCLKALRKMDIGGRSSRPSSAQE